MPGVIGPFKPAVGVMTKVSSVPRRTGTASGRPWRKISVDGRDVARIIPSLCKGGGACVPVCPQDAIDVEGYTDVQITAMIDSLIKEVS